MTENEAVLLKELRRLRVWDLQVGSFKVHLHSDGFPAKIEITKVTKVDRKLSTIQDILSLTGNPIQ